jgi:hypothetical protein
MSLARSKSALSRVGASEQTVGAAALGAMGL